MKLYLLLASLLTTSMAYVAVRSPPCREDEVHLECASACHPTCDTYDEPVDVCTTQCVAGCHCIKGLFRTESGECVPVEKCEG